MALTRHLIALLLFGIAVALATFGARSYTINEGAWRGSKTYLVHLNSWYGQVSLSAAGSLSPDEPPIGFYSTRHTVEQLECVARKRDLPSAFACNVAYRLGIIEVKMPHWFLALGALGLAFAVRPGPRLRVSLRELLMAIALAAFVVACFTAIPTSEL